MFTVPLEKFHTRSIKKTLPLLDDFFLDGEKFSILGKICIKTIKYHRCPLGQFSLCGTERLSEIAGLALLHLHTGANREETLRAQLSSWKLGRCIPDESLTVS